jgi:hypothetical protein
MTSFRRDSMGRITADGRSGWCSSKMEMGQAMTECHWTADNGTEFGGYCDVWKRMATAPQDPVKETIDYLFIGTRGFDFNREETNDNGKQSVKTFIRPLNMVSGPVATSDSYQKAVFHAIPVLLDPNQDVLTYDPSRPGQTGRATRAPTISYTQDEISGRVSKTNFGSGNYSVGQGNQGRQVAWEHFERNGEPLTSIWSVQNDGQNWREIELPKGNRLERPAGFTQDLNFTGRLLESVLAV